MDEIEALYVKLGMQADDSSVVKTVDNMLNTVQQKIKSSVYGGKNGAIAIPATIEGTYANGKKIEKEITDAYAAIYKTIKEMADESVSLTVEDVSKLNKQINAFTKKTSNKQGNNTIANASTNLQQVVSAYQGLMNDLNSQLRAQQAQVKKEAQRSIAKTNAKRDKAMGDTAKERRPKRST